MKAVILKSHITQTSKILNMKKLMSLKLKSWRLGMLGLFLTGLTAFSANAQMEIVGKIKNLKQQDPNTFTFEVWLVNKSTSTETIKLSGFQIGVDFDGAAIANGGQITTRQIEENPAIPQVQRLHKPNLSTPVKNNGAKINHWRIAAQVLGAGNSHMGIEISREGLWYGTYEIKNNVPFAANSKPSFKWNLLNGQGKTRSLFLGYVGKNQVSTRFTNPAFEGHLFSVEEVEDITLNPLSKTNPIQRFSENSFTSIYPNPAHEKITLDIQSITEEPVVIEIIDATGKVVMNQTEKLEMGNVKMTMNIRQLAAGSYTVRMKLKEGDLVSRFIKE